MRIFEPILARKRRQYVAIYPLKSLMLTGYRLTVSGDHTRTIQIATPSGAGS